MLITREGIEHGSYRTGGACVDDAVDRFLISGQVPATGTVCAQEPPAPTAPGTLG